MNRLVPVANLLRRYYDIDVATGLVFRCPFPAHGSADTHKSAKFFANSNCVWCFAEQRRYSAYDIMKLQGYTEEVMAEFLSQHLSDVEALGQEEHVARVVPDTLVEAARVFRMTGEYAGLREQLQAYLWGEDGT